jgi:N-acetylglucosaminyldiphosphoundecaprenol N-acetyl-beta-D-mannosaminyltransferase
VIATVALFGLQVAKGPRKDILDWAAACALSGRSSHVVTLNAEMIVRGAQDVRFRMLLERAELLIADGQSIARSARRIAGEAVEVYPGIEFAFDLVRESRERDFSVFLLGSKPGVADAAAAKLRETLPGCRIAGAHHGYFRGFDEKVVERINASGAKVLLAGMGSPYQELWLDEWRPKLSAGLVVGVGGSFEVWSGAFRRAPGWINAAGLEWLYRAMLDPRRIARLEFIPHYLSMERDEAFRAKFDAGGKR